MNTDIKKNTTQLSKLINDSINLYERALDKIDDQYVRSIFSEMIAIKKDVKLRLSNIDDHELEMNDGDTTLQGKLKELLGKVSAPFTEDNLSAYIGQLKKNEEKVLDQLHEVGKIDNASKITDVVQSTYPSLLDCFDKIKALARTRDK